MFQNNEVVAPFEDQIFYGDDNTPYENFPRQLNISKNNSMQLNQPSLRNLSNININEVDNHHHHKSIDLKQEQQSSRTADEYLVDFEDFNRKKLSTGLSKYGNKRGRRRINEKDHNIPLDDKELMRKLNEVLIKYGFQDDNYQDKVEESATTPLDNEQSFIVKSLKDEDFDLKKEPSHDRISPSKCHLKEIKEEEEEQYFEYDCGNVDQQGYLNRKTKKANEKSEFHLLQNKSTSTPGIFQQESELNTNEADFLKWRDAQAESVYLVNDNMNRNDKRLQKLNNIQPKTEEDDEEQGLVLAKIEEEDSDYDQKDDEEQYEKEEDIPKKEEPSQENESDSEFQRRHEHDLQQLRFEETSSNLDILIKLEMEAQQRREAQKSSVNRQQTQQSERQSRSYRLSEDLKIIVIMSEKANPLNGYSSNYWKQVLNLGLIHRPHESLRDRYKRFIKYLTYENLVSILNWIDRQGNVEGYLNFLKQKNQFKVFSHVSIEDPFVSKKSSFSGRRKALPKKLPKKALLKYLQEYPSTSQSSDLNSALLKQEGVLLSSNDSSMSDLKKEEEFSQFFQKNELLQSEQDYLAYPQLMRKPTRTHEKTFISIDKTIETIEVDCIDLSDDDDLEKDEIFVMYREQSSKLFRKDLKQQARISALISSISSISQNSVR